MPPRPRRKRPGARRRFSVSPHAIEPLHPIDDERDVRILVRSMRRWGWVGRPVLVEETPFARRPYQAWGATHRLAAARRAPLVVVPIVLVDLKKWARAYGHPLAVDITDDDEDRCVALYEAGDVMAAEVMREEVEMNLSANAHGAL